jgi:hypothetical protein
MCRIDATAASRRSLGVATIVPLCNASIGACQQANRAPTRVPTARGLLLAWQLAKNRAAELLAGDQGGFCPGGKGDEGDGVIG